MAVVKTILLALVFAATAAAQTASLGVINALITDHPVQGRHSNAGCLDWSKRAMYHPPLGLVDHGWNSHRNVSQRERCIRPIDRPTGRFAVTGSVRVYLNGLRMCAGTCSGITPDYSISGSTITFNTASIPIRGRYPACGLFSLAFCWPRRCRGRNRSVTRTR